MRICNCTGLMIRSIVNDELEMMWKEAVVAYFKILTPCSRVIVEKLLVTQLVKKVPALLGPECSLPCSQ